MKKLNDLRTYLLKRIPELERNPDQLTTAVHDGNIVFYRGPNYSHQYQAKISVVVTDWRGTADDFVLPVIEWMQVREPGMNPETAIRFETEIINRETIDLALTLEVTERVVVAFKNGERTITHVLPEPELQMNEGATWVLHAEAPGDTTIIPSDSSE